MTTALDINAAQQNIMNAIYQRTASTPTPLTPGNCQAELNVSDDGERLLLESNDIANVLCPLLYLKAHLTQFGSKIYDETKQDGTVAHLVVNVRFKYFQGGSNGVDFAFFRLAKDGSIIEQSFEMDH